MIKYMDLVLNNGLLKNSETYNDIDINDVLINCTSKHMGVDGITYDDIWYDENTMDIRDGNGNKLGLYVGMKDVTDTPIYSNHILIPCDKDGLPNDSTFDDGFTEVDVIIDENNIPKFGVSNQHCSHCEGAFENSNQHYKIVGVTMENGKEKFYVRLYN